MMIFMKFEIDLPYVSKLVLWFNFHSNAQTL
jgi:hypothetical protein